MNTEKKIRLFVLVSLLVTLAAVALSVVAILTEFESDIGYFAHFAPLHTMSAALIVLLIVFVLVMMFNFGKRELCPVLNYNSSAFRFFASMSACLSLLCTYVEVTTLISNMKQSDSDLARGNIFTALSALLSFFSFFVYITYCFGKNEKKSSRRGLLGMVAVFYLIIHLMETHFTRNVQMNNPIKLAQQFALAAAILALLYTFKCEFPIQSANPRLRMFFLCICPAVVLSFALPAIVGYYGKIYMSFPILVDAIFLICVCGFTVTSYMPYRHARVVASEEWDEYDEELAKLNSDADEGAENETTED